MSSPPDKHRVRQYLLKLEINPFATTNFPQVVYPTQIRPPSHVLYMDFHEVRIQTKEVNWTKLRKSNESLLFIAHTDRRNVFANELMS